MNCLTGCAADPARLAVALVNVELLAEVAGIAVGADVVAQRGAADLHGHGQRRLDGARQLRAFHARQRTRLATRANARAEQRFARVDVADADHEPCIHDQLLDGDAAASRDLPEVCRIELVFERLGREAAQQRVRRGIVGREQQAAEAARIVEAQRVSGIEFDVDVIVRNARRRDRQHAQAARHPEMQDQRAGIGLEQQVFRAASCAPDRAAGHRLDARDVHGPAQAPVVHAQSCNAASYNVRFDPAAGGFDFG